MKQVHVAYKDRQLTFSARDLTYSLNHSSLSVEDSAALYRGSRSNEVLTFLHCDLSWIVSVSDSIAMKSDLVCEVERSNYFDPSCKDICSSGGLC